MQSILAGLDKVILDTSGGTGVVPYPPLPQLRSGRDEGIGETARRPMREGK
jgi:hypothetical protein